MSENLDLEQLRAVMALLPDPIFVLDEDGLYVACMGMAGQSIQRRGETLSGFTVGDLMTPEFTEWALSEIRDTLDRPARGPRHIEYRLRADNIRGTDPSLKGDGEETFEAMVAALPFRVNGKRCVLWVARNVSEQRQTEADLTVLAARDDLTGLLNRRAFLAEVAGPAATGPHQALLMIDIDNFKQVNDRHGHPMGDMVLRQLADFLSKRLRANDYLARLGGDEFAALITSASQEDLRKLGDRLRSRVLRHRFGTAEVPVALTISLGVAQITPGESVDGVLQRADRALYRSKAAGRNRSHMAPAPGLPESLVPR